MTIKKPLAMWGNSEEPPGTMEAGPPESVVNLQETYEQNKTQLESVKEIMQRNKQSLKKKEEELQEYAKKLSKFKTRAKRSNRDDATSSNESTPKSKSDTTEPSDDVVDDISQAKTPKAKSSLLQKKLAEDRKIFEQRSKELTESKRAVEEKVEQLRQQLEENYAAPVSVVTPMLVTSQAALPLLELSQAQDKDNKIAELSNKILELEATIIDLQDNLKEKDSVIDSKTKAVTLMSADLSMKGKTTLDTLEDTKDEMRAMQENFVLVESSLRTKNDHLLQQLEEKTDVISKLEATVQSLTDQLEAQKQAGTACADLSRSTMDTLADTKDEMRAMQENFVLMETSLKAKNEHLLKQLEEREMKLAEAEARILSLESGIGIEKPPNADDLVYKIEKLEAANRALEDEKFELQKSNTELQEKIITVQSSVTDNLNAEKDNRITELETLVEELKKSNVAIEEACRAKMQKQIDELNEKNQELASKVIELEKQVYVLESDNVELATKLSTSVTDVSKEEEVRKLTKELDELNKSMIKLKTQHKAKLKNLQKQLENFKKVSDKNAEIVKLGNQVAVLEEEKGNLQLSLVDFDELKAAAGDLQARVNDLEGKVGAQAKEIQAHIEAIAMLENQKLDLMQELHAVKQEVSSLEAENAELENARVTAEMKLIELEDENENHGEAALSDDEKSAELQRQIDTLKEENERLAQKISKLEDAKSSSEVGSTESFVKTGSNVDSTESFEALAADADKADLLRKIDALTRENQALLEKLARYEEKGSSDAGSTESFEKIPEHGDSSATKVDMLTRENYELVVKLTKLEEQVASQPAVPRETSNRFGLLSQENERLISEVNELQEQLDHIVREKRSIEDQSVVPLAIEEVQQDTEAAPAQSEEDTATTVSSDTVKDAINVDELVTKIEGLTVLNDNLASSLLELQQAREDLQKEKQEFTAARMEEKSSAEAMEVVADQLQEVEQPVVPEEASAVESSVQLSAHVADEKPATAAESEAIASLEAEIERCNALIAEQTSVIEDMKIKMAEKERELNQKSTQLAAHNEVADLNVQTLQKELQESASVIAEWKLKCSDMEAKIETLEHSRKHIDQGFQALQEENKNLIEQSEHKDALVISLREELDSALNSFEAKMKDQGEVIASQEELINELRRGVENKDHELQAKYSQLQGDLIKIDELQEHLNKLQGQIQQRDTTITSLTEEVEVLRTNTSLVEEDLFAARHQLSGLHEKLEHSKSLDEYNQAVERLNEKEILVEELESKVSQKIAEASALRNQAESLGSENEQLRAQLQEEERKVSELLEGNQAQEEAMRNAERAKAEIENRLLDLQAMHDENLKHANNITGELQDAYRMLEQLKFKHTEDMEMLNRRLEDVIEELHSKSQELISVQGELDEKNSALVKTVPEEVKINLEGQVAELEKKLAEAEEKIHTQLEKMKKYAAVAKKKTAQCEELENKIKELEEQLYLEKNEKDAINKELQESLSHVQEKDNKITEMEQELQSLQAERDEALSNLDSLKAELSEAHEKLNALEEEIKTLSEAKDTARELGVRMQVMEAEYMEQMAQINSLKAENGFLQSKQTQINERLENVEKESNERRDKLEKLEKEKEIAEMERTEACQQMCGQCATQVQALESKLQERDAEFENLNNELHNSIDNLVQENLRLSTLAAQPDPGMQQSYNDLMMQYNVLSATNEEMKNKHEATLRENEDLAERIARLQELNAAMHERIEAVESELSKDKESVASYDTLNKQYTELVEKFDSQRAELEATQTRLQEAALASESSQRNLMSRIELLEQEKQNLVLEYENLKSAKESVVSGDGWGFDASQDLIGVEAHQQLTEEPVVTESAERQKREVDETLVAKEESPPLFDASVFGAPPVPQNVNAELELELGNLREQVNSLSSQLQRGKMMEEDMRAQLDHEVQHARVTIEYLKEELRNMNASRGELEAMLGSRDSEMMALKDNVSSANHAFDTVKTDYENLATVLEEKDAVIESIKSERAEYLSHLEQLSHEKQEIQRVVDHLLSNLAIVDNSSSVVGKLVNLQSKIDTFLTELETVKSDNQQLSAAQEVYKKRALELEKEVKTTSDSARLAELESRIARVISERDILQLQYNDVSRAFEDLQESADGMRNLQAQLESVSRERDELVSQLQALKPAQHVPQQQEPVQEQIQLSEQSAEVAAAAPAPQKQLSTDSMWEDDEDPWGYEQRIPHTIEEHQHIPVVPSAELQLKVKVDELEEKLKELTDENAKLIEEGKLAQIKNVKYVKKLKEYKVQFDNLQRQLKSQQSLGGFGDLDSAIEEELKSQVEALEKALAEAKEETKKVAAEKENLLKRIDVLTAATERFTEAKEKQDTEVHIWQMRYKELQMKLQQFDFGPETMDSSSSPPPETVQVNPQYEEELKELRDNVDALAAENEELQQLLEEHRTKRQTSVDESAAQVQELQAKIAELAASNDKLKSDYDHLRKQYEQSLMDANDQVQNMRQNCEIMKSELIDKSVESEKLVAELQVQLHAAVEAKTQLETRVQSLETDLGKLNSTTASVDELTALLRARVEEVANLKEQLVQQQVERTHLLESSGATEQQLTDALNYKQTQLDHLNAALAEKDAEIATLKAELEELRGTVEKVKGLELSIEGYVTEVQEKNEEIRALREKIHDYETALSDKEHALSTQQSQLQQSASEIQQCTTRVQEQQDLGQQLIEAKHRIDQLTNAVAEKEEALERSNDEMRKLLVELQSKKAEAEELKSRLEAAVQEQQSARKEVTQVDLGAEKKVVEDNIPVFTFGSDSNDQELQHLREQLKAKSEEVEHLQYSLNEGSLTKLIQELQDDINTLYNDKAELESTVIARNQEVAALKTQLQEIHHNQPLQKRSLDEQEELMKLQNELHEREQQMNELRYVVAERESQLRAALQQASREYEQQDSQERLRSELYEKQQELESAKFTVAELQREVASLRGLERLAGEDRATIERLSSEKEEVRRQAEEALERILKEKESEMDALKQQLVAENQNLVEALGLRERDLENLKIQIEQSGFDRDGALEQRTEQLTRLEAELAERDRRLAELSITKDAEIHNLRVQLSEKTARLEELLVLSAEEEAQLAEMRQIVEVKEQQINGLTQQLDEKTKEYDLMQHALQRRVDMSDQSTEVQQQLQQSASQAADPSTSDSSNELDLALYMLHQRDVRCEELTQELMQLLEERDTLQLRLSNAIRVNEELRVYAAAAAATGSSPQKDTETHQGGSGGDVADAAAEPLIENPSPSKSEGPVEIAKEAINSPIGEDKKALAQKLSQLRSVNQGKDVRLKDERELRHTQMTLMAHKEALSKLPPEAAARLVNANYTLSRDVQSQSSVLLNWLWGKSTPKVVHM